MRLAIKSFQLGSLQSSATLIHLAFPASSAALISLYRGKGLLSVVRGEQEQKKTANKRSGIKPNYASKTVKFDAVTEDKIRTAPVGI